MFNYLCANRQLYNIKGKALQLAILDKEQEVNFTYYPGVSIISGISDDRREVKEVVTSYIKNSEGKDLLDEEIDSLLEVKLESRQLKVKAKTISQIIEEEKIERIDLLKVDVENSEHFVINGIADNDWSKIGNVIIEVHDTNGRLQIIKNTLEQKGFTTHIEKEEMLSKDDILYNLFAVRKGNEKALSTIGDKEKIRATQWMQPQTFIKNLKEQAEKKLPSYMIPANFILLDQFPLTQNGKVDKKALPDAELPIETLQHFEAARNETEQQLTEIWQQLLGRENVGIRDNFFDLGGHFNTCHASHFPGTKKRSTLN